jgi:hypothetical protein
MHCNARQSGEGVQAIASVASIDAIDDMIMIM